MFKIGLIVQPHIFIAFHKNYLHLPLLIQYLLLSSNFTHLSLFEAAEVRIQVKRCRVIGHEVKVPAVPRGWLYPERTGVCVEGIVREIQDAAGLEDPVGGIEDPAVVADL